MIFPILKKCTIILQKFGVGLLELRGNARVHPKNVHITPSAVSFIQNRPDCFSCPLRAVEKQDQPRALPFSIDGRTSSSTLLHLPRLTSHRTFWVGKIDDVSGIGHYLVRMAVPRPHRHPPVQIPARQTAGHVAQSIGRGSAGIVTLM